MMLQRSDARLNQTRARERRYRRGQQVFRASLPPSLAQVLLELVSELPIRRRPSRLQRMSREKCRQRACDLRRECYKRTGLGVCPGPVGTVQVGHLAVPETSQ